MLQSILKSPPLYLILGWEFPDPYLDYLEGWVGVSKELTTRMLISGYSQGFFCWFQDQWGYFNWYILSERMIIFPGEVTETRKLRQKLRSKNWEFKINCRFEEVINHCRQIPRKNGQTTWINNNFVEAYTRLYKTGFALSVESYYKGKLVGGFYGVLINRYFSGESMFHLKSDASKLALIYFGNYVAPKMGIQLIDCQVPSDHLKRMGGKIFKRKEFVPMIWNASGFNPSKLKK